jgi:23S rRNA (cytosine1962-C5)-methyltransferase
LKPTIRLKPKEHHRIERGHLWVFTNEIQSIDGSPQAGDIVYIKRNDGALLGTGFYNPHSLIAVRLLSRTDEEISFEFFSRRIEYAHKLRTRLFPGSKMYRIVHGESDNLPGLIIDRYGTVIVIQTLSSGMDKRKTLICDVIEDLFSPVAIVEKNESHLRTLEHLPDIVSVLRGSVPHSTLCPDIDGVQFEIDVIKGQKTGWFLDQRRNHHLIRQAAPGEEVLDCYSYQGGFGIHAASAGAAHVTCVDTSAEAIVMATKNAQHNKLEKKFTGISNDVPNMLQRFRNEGKKFGLIILDPPSFTRSKKNVPAAIKAYRSLHESAMLLLIPGGYLATACCSFHIFSEIFEASVTGAAERTDRSLQIITRSGASPDHPVLPEMPETEYLKFVLYRVG